MIILFECFINNEIVEKQAERIPQNVIHYKVYGDD